MSSDASFTKENLDTYLLELSKEYRKLSKGKMPAEIILVGGASVLINYGFRAMTYDMDGIIEASSVMKEAINRVGDRNGLPTKWLNTECTQTKSYSSKLSQVSSFYKTFSNVLSVRTVAGEYLIAMKLMSGREYKSDLSDVAGILWEHQKAQSPVTFEMVDAAVCVLYGNWDDIPAKSVEYIKATFENGDFESLYLQKQISERDAEEILLDINKQYPKAINESNVSDVLEQARAKRKKQRNDHGHER